MSMSEQEPHTNGLNGDASDEEVSSSDRGGDQASAFPHAHAMCYVEHCPGPPSVSIPFPNVMIM